MIERVLKLAATAAGVWVAVRLVSGLEFDGSIWALIGVAILIAVVNAFVKPILKILSLPVVLLTLGLFLLVINGIALAIVLWLAAPERLDLGFTSTGFFWATFLGALVISIVSWVLEAILLRE
jgi:putative membrane protein